MSGLSRRSLLAGVGAAALLTPLVGCSAPPGARNSLELFQFKSEAIALFDEICERFNAANPGLPPVRQNFQADNVTALRVRLVKGDTPDLITINGDYAFGSIDDRCFAVWPR